MYKIIIYDFDGVLVNSREAVRLYFKDILEHCGLKDTPWHKEEEFNAVYALSERQLMEQFVPKELHGKFSSYAPKYSFEELVAHTPLEQEVAVVIPALAEKYPLAICTNRYNPVESILRHYHLDECFKFTVTVKDAAPKPSPEGLNKILEHFGVYPSEALYIGDSIIDFEAAKGAGITFLGYKNTFDNSPLLAQHSEIYEWLSR